MRFSIALTLQLLGVSATDYFHHKARHAAVVIGNTLYIDGGEVATWNKTGNGFWNRSTITNVKDPNTYYIDLSSSWSGDSVTLTSFPKSPPVLESQAFWSNTSEQAFTYNGGISLAGPVIDSIPANQLWALTPAGQTRWSSVSSNGNFSYLVRTLEGSYASGNGLGFALGGHVGQDTLKDAAAYNVGGMVMYNMTSQLWYNVSAGGDYAGGSNLGVAHLITNFGTSGVGILLALAGLTTQNTYVGMDRATLFDPVTQQWRTQRLTGDIPQPVVAPCLTGVAGDNGTYEVFMYGGMQQEYRADNERWVNSDGSVYVLSLPAFNWFRVSGSATGRWRHTCTASGPRSRQMISVGGIVVPGPLNNSDFNIINTGAPDPWTKGIGVFDMTKLQWGSYSQSSSDYVTPDVVKAYYTKNGVYPGQWDDPAVQRWFTVKAATNTSTGTSTAPSASASVSSASPSATATGNQVNAGAIAGGVIGGVAVIALIGVAVWLILRRRKARQGATAVPTSELPATHQRGELDSNPYNGHYNPPYREDKKLAPETPRAPVYELEEPRHELQ